MLPSYYGVNRCSLSRLDFQLQIVSTWSNHNPEIIHPVWFDYESPVLYMVKPVFITTRYGFIINRHNMEGVISTQDSDYHPYYKKLVNQRCDSMSQVWCISYLIILKSTALVINHGFMLGIMTRPVTNRQDIFNLLYTETRVNKAAKDHKHT